MSPDRKDVQRIWGKSKSGVGDITIHIPFPRVKLIIDVYFSIFADQTHSLLCNKDMIEHGLDISLQGGFLHIGDARQLLVLDNYLYIYRRESTSIPYVLYTEDE